MKTREIEFWVEPEDIEALTNKPDVTSVLKLYVRQDAVSKDGQLVKLIQEIPEKSVTITETIFENAWISGYDNAGKDLREMKEHIKAELFGEKS